MCVKAEPRKNDDCFRTSYQRAHYYENVQKVSRTAGPEFEVRLRPDLYVYDPIINEKITTYQKCYGDGKLQPRDFEFHGKYDLSSKYTLKNLYDEFRRKPPKTLKYDKTISGAHYNDPSNSFETRLLQNFCTDNPPNKINRSFKEQHCRTEFLEPYVSTAHLEHEDFSDSRLHGIAKDDTITYYNGRVKNKVPPGRRFYQVKPRVFFKVPFGGDLSIYREDYENPEVRSDFLYRVCAFPRFFEATKTEASDVPGMYSTEHKQLGSGKAVRAIV